MSDTTKVIEVAFAQDSHNITQPCSASPVDDATLPTAEQLQRAVTPPTISVRLGIDRVVFLITDLQDPPELDVYAPAECRMRFHLLPGLLLTSSNCQIVCPLLLGHKAISGKVQILQAAMEKENPFYGLSMFAKVLELPEYMELVPPEISACLPYNLVKELFPDEATAITIGNPTDQTASPPSQEQTASLNPQALVKVNLNLPSGHRLPELYRGKIVRISLSLYARTGGLALNDLSPLLVNSRSRPTRIHLAAPADDYYQLRGTNSSLPVTSKLPDFYEDYTDLTDPTAALLARRGIKT